jgi:hypothetical protein
VAARLSSRRKALLIVVIAVVVLPMVMWALVWHDKPDWQRDCGSLRPREICE